MRTSIMNITRSLMAAAMIFLVSCVSAEPAKSEYRKVSDFTGIKAGGAFLIMIVQGKDASVKVEAEQQMLGRIRTEVKNGILNIYTEGKTETDSPMKIYITMNELKKIEINGASRLKSDAQFTSGIISLSTSGAGSIDLDIKANEVEINSTGAGKIEVKGFAAKLTAKLTGASSLDAYNLQTTFVAIKANDASNAKINATETFNAQANGASYINYKGAPGKKTINTSGASSVEKEGA
jgi:hypothetical protein